MKKNGDLDFTSILYLAYALPALRERSEEAAAMLEAAILECTMALSSPQGITRELDVATFLRYALDDVAVISPLAGGMLRRAIGSLGEVRQSAVERPIYLH